MWSWIIGGTLVFLSGFALRGRGEFEVLAGVALAVVGALLLSDALTVGP